MAKPTVRIPKDLLPIVSKTADERGVRPSLLVGQAIRFYLAATDPALVASAVTDAIKPIASDLRHLKYVLDQQASDRKPATPSRSKPEASGSERRNIILELAEQKRRDALARMQHKSSSSSSNPTGTHP